MAHRKERSRPHRPPRSQRTPVNLPLVPDSGDQAEQPVIFKVTPRPRGVRPEEALCSSPVVESKDPEGRSPPMSFSFRSLSLSVLALTLTAGIPAHAAKPKQPPASSTAEKPAVEPALFKSLKWREVGPYRGGRSAAVTGVPGDRNTYYFGATGGGVWKTTDGGRTWKSVSDGSYGGSIGAVAVSEWDPNVVYVGGGEVTLRGNVSPGNGLWKSTDAGATWTSLGFADAQHIPRIRIHP